MEDNERSRDEGHGEDHADGVEEADADLTAGQDKKSDIVKSRKTSDIQYIKQKNLIFYVLLL